MGKFDGVLLASDYDNTLVYTQSIFDGGGAVPPIPPYNLQRLRYFTENGGRFTLVSGRTWALWNTCSPACPSTPRWASATARDSWTRPPGPISISTPCRSG